MPCLCLVLLCVFVSRERFNMCVKCIQLLLVVPPLAIPDRIIFTS